MVAVQSAVHIRVYLVYSGSGYAGGLAKKNYRETVTSNTDLLFSSQGSKRVKYVVTRFYLRLNLLLKERCSGNQKSRYIYSACCSIVQSKLRNEIKMNSM